MNPAASTDDDLIAWLMQGDPAIRWQTMRDLLDLPEADWQAERRLTLQAGWGKHYLELQAADGSWGGGIYSPKWVSTTYTLLTLCAIGIPRDHPPAVNAAALVLERELGSTCDDQFMRNLEGMDRCIVGMDLQIAAYFELRDGRIAAMLENLLAERMADGAWNCRRPDGTWSVQHKYPGRSFFDMEKVCGPSRWNTLRALRVLKWWESQESPAVKSK